MNHSVELNSLNVEKKEVEDLQQSSIDENNTNNNNENIQNIQNINNNNNNNNNTTDNNTNNSNSNSSNSSSTSTSPKEYQRLINRNSDDEEEESISIKKSLSKSLRQSLSLQQGSGYKKLDGYDSSPLSSLPDSGVDEMEVESSFSNEKNYHRKGFRKSTNHYYNNDFDEKFNLSTIRGFFYYIFFSLRYTLLGDLRVAIKYVYNNSKKNLKSLILGLLTVFLVVLFISFLQNLIQASPIVFLKLSEDQSGELDLVLTASGDSIASTNTSLQSGGGLKGISYGQRDEGVGAPSPFPTSFSDFDINKYFINSTYLTKTLAPASMVHGVAPRWMSLAVMRSETVEASLILLVMNTQLEKDLDLGRGWNHPPLVGNQAHITSTFLRRIGVLPNVGQTVDMHLDFVDIMARLGASGAIPTLEQFEKMIENYIGQPIPNKIDISLYVFLYKLDHPDVDVVGLLKEYFGNGVSDNGNTLYPKIIIENYYNSFRGELVIDRTLVVIDGIDEPGGKYPSSLGNVGVLESAFINDLIQERLLNVSARLNSRNLTEIEDFFELASAIYPNLNITQFFEQYKSFIQNFKNFATNFKIDDYAMSPIVMLENRVSIYTSDDKQMKLSMMEFTNQVATRLGYSYPAAFTTPLSTTLAIFKYTKLSLNQIFNCVATVLLVLGALMIYSLLLSDVEGKTFEYGMLRAQGMRHYSLIILLLTQAIYFSIPGILFGLFFGWTLYAVVAHFVYQFVIVPINLTFYPTAIVSGILMGFFMPIVANIAPIQRALSRTLRDALDVYHQVKNETIVKIMKLEEVGVDPLQTLLSILAVLVGFTVYYLIPMSYTFRNLNLFFVILTAILMGMLFGLSMLAQSIQSFVERAIVFLLIWGNDRRVLYNLVRKNLFSHSNRNSKTATMFTISLTFIIFTGCVFRLQGHNIQELVKLGIGSDISVQSLSSRSPLPEIELRGYLDNEIVNNSKTSVAGYTVVSFPLDSVINIRETRLKTLADNPDVRVRVYGLESNFLQNVYRQFYDYSQLSQTIKFPTVPGTNGKLPDIVNSLFTNAHKQILIPEDQGGKISPPPSIISTNSTIFDPTNPIWWWLRNHFTNDYVYRNYTDVVISEAFRLSAGASPNTPFNLFINFKQFATATNSINLLAKPQSMVSMFPSFFFSSYAQTAVQSPVLISMNEFYNIMGLVYNLTSDSSVIMPSTPPKSKILVRLKEGTTQLQREGVINGLKNYIKTDNIQVIDTQFLLDSTTTAVTILDIFFYTVSCAAIILCFFMLWVSFSANIHENSWEFGVLRSLGLTNFQVTRIYIYEALVLILSSMILGLLIGLGIALTLTLQFDLFTQLPFSFQFPYGWFFGVLGSSIIIAILVSWSASAEYRNRQIASVLKGK
eukprot:gene6778-8410_t